MKIKKLSKYAIALAIILVIGGIAYAAYTTLPMLVGINGAGFRLPNDSAWHLMTPDVSVGSPACGRNTGSAEIFVPAKTATEWTRVTSTNVPAGVSYDSNQCVASNYCWEPAVICELGPSGSCTPGSPAKWSKCNVSPALYTNFYCMPDTGECPAADRCVITLDAGGAGGVPSNIKIGWGVNIDNTKSSTACSASLTYSDTPTAGQGTPTAAAYSTKGYGPEAWVSGSLPYPVSLTANSVTCPTGTTLSAPEGMVASCSLNGDGTCASGNESIQLICQ